MVKKIENYKTHPVADAFPMMEGDEFKRLVADIKAHGQHEPIWIWNGQIIDGRNRARACKNLGIAPKIVEYSGDDPVGFSVSLNVVRRHMDESQRAMVAARLAQLTPGRPSKLRTNAEFPSQAEAAVLLNVGERTVTEAKAVLDNAVPEVAEAVDRGQLSVKAASQLAKLPQAIQRGIADRAWGGEEPMDDDDVRDLVRNATPKSDKPHDQRCKYNGEPCPTCRCRGVP